MKFHQLPTGSRFRFRDTLYRKTSPLQRVDETDGAQELIPRSAEVRRLDDAQAVPERRPGEVVETAASKAIGDGKRALQRSEPALTKDRQAQKLAAVEAATREMLATLADR